ncbi:hypothetical protein [Kangiella sediminilitoris]|uniref:hypothetical protein n=1 Tax=Kangiella sediminilitoris TaxID=1144748 RepID=UPI00083D8EBF|nr:hypothetical protein [Kangiella sediminilitoris]
MESIQLTYPSTQEGQEFMMDNRPAAVRQWLEEQTFTDINQSLRELLHAAKTFNRSESKLTYREENLDTLSQGYLQMSRHFRQHNDQRVVTPTDQQIKLLSQLTAELAYGYKRVVHELAEQKMALKKQVRLAHAINQAQHYLGLHLIEHYQQYAPIPSYIWHELHKLYHFAERESLHQLKQANGSEETLQALDSIENTYKRNCLMSVINPYHTEGNLHWHLFKYFGHWSKTTYLSSDLKQYSDSECFIIDLLSSRRPEYAAADVEYEEHSLYRLLITTELLKELQHQLKFYEQHHKLPQHGFYPSIDKNSGYKLLQQIYAYCDHHIERKDPRYPSQSNINLTIGLSPVFNVLSQLKHPLLDIKQENDYPHLIRWQATNYSKGGVCLKQPLADVSSLNVGNIVFIRKESSQSQGLVGIIRWLNGNRSTGASMGVEYLKGKAEPCHYLTRNRQGETVQHKVILIHYEAERQMLLITPRNLVGNKTSLSIQSDGTISEYHVIATKDSNSLVTVFAVVPNN